MRLPVGPLRGPDPSERVSAEARSDGRRQIREFEQKRRRLRSRRIKAVLAGGLVFGIGSAATLAAWTDTEEASGSFEAGRFNIEMAVDGSAWSNNSEATFDASGMYPGSKVYAPVLVRTTSNTTIDGELSVASKNGNGQSGGIVDSLVYRAVTESLAANGETSFKCGENSFSGSPTYVYGSASSTIPFKTEVGGAKSQSVSRASESVTAYCFEVTLPSSTPTTAQGTEASKTWKFFAESVPTEKS